MRIIAAAQNTAQNTYQMTLTGLMPGVFFTRTLLSDDTVPALLFRLPCFFIVFFGLALLHDMTSVSLLLDPLLI